MSVFFAKRDTSARYTGRDEKTPALGHKSKGGRIMRGTC